MLGLLVLCILTLRFYSACGQADCTDLRGRSVSHGLHYVPGPDTCTLCICDNGLPKACKAVLCSPPQDCRSFRVGSTCCEFICLDDVVKPAEGAEANVRVAAGGAAAVVLLTVALVVYRVRKQKRRRPPHTDDQRSLTSIGYISGSMGYMGGTCETALAAWKPPGNYLPRGEAPPPYDEAVAQCRQEQVSRASNEPPYHRTYPASVETMCGRPDDVMHCTSLSHANIPRTLQQIPNPQNCYNAPLLQTVHAPEPRESNPVPHHPLAPNMVGFPSAIRLTGSLGAISNRGLLSLLQREPEPALYTTPAPMHAALHRTIPRISTAAEAMALDGLAGGGGVTPGVGFAGGGEVRRSFHRPAPCERERLADARRSMPRNLNLAADLPPPLLMPTRDMSIIRTCAASVNTGSGGRTSAAGVNTGSGGVGGGGGASAGASSGPSRGRDEAEGAEGKAKLKAPPEACPPPPPPPAPQTLPLTVDKPSCVCSYAGAGPGRGGAGDGAEGEGEDDYRSECENCKAASNSRWAVEGESAWAGAEEDGTQTLQRRAPPPAPPPPATATLPQPVTKQPRTMMGPSNWENWFNTIPDSDSESEEE